ncbi:hypothetical protein J2T56_002490 [Natronobacillus azotifigens]|uniref:Uncharacterized protein n=1 Tax=Natronobacillus azotifigens TaxID=472978 RepID=A0A9J6REL8_9BACI|nr:hypothetical protein [Natronobacillus azotifigens]MCZ0704194.1 hypothetical protein [Natronobacillus azotifigens]
MKKTTIKIFSVVLFCGLLFSSHVFAARTTLTLPENQTWVSRDATRSGDHSNVHSRLYAVYPTNGGNDNFTRIQVKVTSSSGTSMSSIYTLNETSSVNSSIKLSNGTLNNKKIKFQFRGNHPDHGAKADVYYNAR